MRIREIMGHMSSFVSHDNFIIHNPYVTIIDINTNDIYDINVSSHKWRKRKNKKGNESEYCCTIQYHDADTIENMLTGDYEFYDPKRLYSMIVITAQNPPMGNIDTIKRIMECIETRYHKITRHYTCVEDCVYNFSISYDRYWSNAYEVIGKEYYNESISVHRAQLRAKPLIDDSIISANSVIFISTFFNNEFRERDIENIKDVEFLIRDTFSDGYKVDLIHFGGSCGLISDT